MTRTLEGLCRSRPFKVERRAGSSAISVTIDGEPQQFDRPGAAAATRNQTFGLADFYCTGDAFTIAIVRLDGSRMYLDGKIQPRKPASPRRAMR